MVCCQLPGLQQQTRWLAYMLSSMICMLSASPVNQPSNEGMSTTDCPREECCTGSWNRIVLQDGEALAAGV